ncbi:MAG: C_GCAxxG_C_C family protein [Deltaproteobacteria bacterium]|nr:C_GCAxxG_C_C family protein [Deltaproteobacteria bacterium]
MISKKEDTMLKAVTGLEGGVVASGSTCGVVTGGALGLALLHEKDLTERNGNAQIAVIGKAREYVEWFDSEFDTTLCRERTGVDFYGVGGQIRYLLPGDKIARCLWHIGRATQKLNSLSETALPGSVERTDARETGIPHCAEAVLRGVRERTGIGDSLLERSSIVFDGGVALTGGVCGALAGAIMAINLLLGKDIRNTKYTSTIKGFVTGHLNLLLDRPVAMPDPFGVGKDIVMKFRGKTGALSCRDIAHEEFRNWKDFIEYRGSSSVCHELIEFSIERASNIIEQWK